MARLKNMRSNEESGTTLQSKEVARQCLLLANKFIKEGDYGRAKTEIEKAQQFDPSNMYIFAFRDRIDHFKKLNEKTPVPPIIEEVEPEIEEEAPREVKVLEKPILEESEKKEEIANHVPPDSAKDENGDEKKPDEQTLSRLISPKRSESPPIRLGEKPEKMVRTPTTKLVPAVAGSPSSALKITPLIPLDRPLRPPSELFARRSDNPKEEQILPLYKDSSTPIESNTVLESISSEPEEVESTHSNLSAAQIYTELTKPLETTDEKRDVSDKIGYEDVFSTSDKAGDEVLEVKDKSVTVEEPISEGEVALPEPEETTDIEKEGKAMLTTSLKQKVEDVSSPFGIPMPEDSVPPRIGEEREVVERADEEEDTQPGKSFESKEAEKDPSEEEKIFERQAEELVFEKEIIKDYLEHETTSKVIQREEMKQPDEEETRRKKGLTPGLKKKEEKILRVPAEEEPEASEKLEEEPTKAFVEEKKILEPTQPEEPAQTKEQPTIVPSELKETVEKEEEKPVLVSLKEDASAETKVEEKKIAERSDLEEIGKKKEIVEEMEKEKDEKPSEVTEDEGEPLKPPAKDLKPPVTISKTIIQVVEVPQSASQRQEIEERLEEMRKQIEVLASLLEQERKAREEVNEKQMKDSVRKYRRKVEKVWLNGAPSEEENEKLRDLALSLNIPQEVENSIEREVKLEMYGKAVKEVIAERVLLRSSSDTMEWLRKVYKVSLKEYLDYELKFLMNLVAEQYKGTILLISSDEELIGLLSPRLKTSGFAVVMAGSPEKALEKIDKVNPHFILSDMEFTHAQLNGIKLLHVLRANSKYNYIPFILLCDKDDFEHLSSSDLRPTEDVIQKPLDFDVLTDVMNRKVAAFREYIASLE